MTDEQINAAIAEACGWRLQGSPEHQKATDGWQFGHTFAINPSGEVVSRNGIPKYCNDLNAMHEAEQHQWRKSYFSRYDYVDQIGKILKKHHWNRMEPVDMLDATARQRAEAFLRTLGKWEATTKESSAVQPTNKN